MGEKKEKYQQKQIIFSIVKEPNTLTKPVHTLDVFDFQEQTHRISISHGITEKGF